MLLAIVLAAINASALAPDLPIAVVDESTLPYDFSPSNYDNSPSNYDNSESNYNGYLSSYLSLS